MSDKDQLQRFLKGDEVTIKRLYRKVLPAVMKFVLQNSGDQNDAEDVFHEALLVIFKKLSTEGIILSASLDTYIYAICRNLWYKVLRTRKNTFFDVDLSDRASDEDIIATLGQTEKERLFRKYFLKLDEKCRRLISLFVKGKSTAEVMAETGYSRGNARKKKFDCKKKLIEMIEKDPVFKDYTSSRQKGTDYA
ncbi:MAG: sigma-70 family RNA polymerase sigma factor [Bacteroidota bacterium]